MLNMKQAAEQVLTLAEQKGLKDVDVVIERNESLDVEDEAGCRTGFDASRKKGTERR